MNYLTNSAYNPSALLDTVKRMKRLKNDAALSIALETTPPHISRVRNKVQSIGDTMLLRMHDITGLTGQEMRKIMGVES